MTATPAAFGPFNPDPLRNLPDDLSIPRDNTGPLFSEPWEARIFAMVGDLNARGLFEWKEFQSLLAEEIRHAEEEGICLPYYENWMKAAERLFAVRGFADGLSVEKEMARLRSEDRTIRLRKE